MAGYPRSDIEADNWQTVSPENWSWLDHVKAYGSDAGNALLNLGSNLVEGVSPFAPTATQYGKPSLQVPPMAQGLADSFSRLIGTPSHPGYAWDLNGVKEHDAPILADGANALLSFAGGQALNPLAVKPAGSVGMFAGRNAKTADLAALSKAEQLAGQGATRDAIWNETGWFQGPDQKWRFEIDDSVSRYKPDTDNPTVADVFTHQSLFDAYPDLGKIPYAREFDQRWNGDRAYEGSFSDDGIKIHDELGSTGGRSTMLHELQHATQSNEGFAKGGNPSQFYPEAMIQKIQELDGLEDSLLGQSWKANDPQERAALKAQSEQAGQEKRALREKAAEWRFGQYRSLAGEVESRNVQKRMNMSAEERKATPPWLTQDVPFEDQIVRLLSDTGKPSLLGSALATAGELPMDHASRMQRAREMGFDTDNVLYHGTGSDFDSFNVDAGTYGTGVYMTPDPRIASEYATNLRQTTGKETGPSVLPLTVKGKIASLNDFEDALSLLWDENTTYSQASSRAMRQLAQDGYSGATHGLGDVLVFDPRNIRSVNAAFDPAKADSANLLAAKVGGLPQSQNNTPPWLQDILNRY